ncbi:hypothetical protein FPV67DRAFT_1469604 [Lyophyllum atratum]|nr:hypothetical protein FPV67DRAFT_1469604 [Lyophyllum atratum]
MERHCDGGDASNDHEASSTVELLPDARQDWETKIVRTGLHKYVYLDDMDASTSPPVSYNERVTKENDRDDHEQAMDIDTNMDAPPVNGVAFGKFKAEPRHELPVVVKKIEDEPTLSDSKPNDLEAHADTDFVPEDDDANLTIDASDAKGRMTPASIKEEQHEIFTADEAPDEGETKHGIKDDSPVPWLAYGKVKAEPHFDVVKKKEEDIELADLGPPDDPQVNKDDVCERIVGDGDVDMDNPDPQGCMTPALNDVEQHEVPHAGHSSTEADEATSTDDKDASLIPWLAYGKFKAEPRPVVIIVKKIEEVIICHVSNKKQVRILKLS